MYATDLHFLRYTKRVSTRVRAPHIVLAGGGHAHLYSLLRTKELVRRGFRVTLIDPSPYLYYSGMATGVISGAYAPGENRIDIHRLVEEGGGSFIEDRVEEIHSESRELLLETGDSVPYDAASISLGSETRADVFADNGTNAIRVKPIQHTAEIRRRLLSSGDRPARVLVVGGGAAGCEVAANALALLGRLDPGGEVTLAETGDSLLPDAPKKAREHVHAVLREKGARILTDTSIVSFGGGVARTHDGHEIPCDLPVLATGVSPLSRDLFRASRLPTGEDGGLWVDGQLRSVGDGRLFGGGDCISYRGKALPRLGVFAVRQGPVIFHNLQAILKNEPLTRYKPQERFLYILNLGGGDGLAVYGPLVWRGRLAWKLKHRIDQRFVESFRA